MADRTIIQLDSIATSAATSAGLTAIHFETQLDGISSPLSRQMDADQIASVIILAKKLVKALASSIVIASSSSAITGNSDINTGLTTLSNVVLTIRGVLGSSSASVAWSPLASAGWFNGRVYANPVSSTSAPAQSGIPVTVDWIAVGQG